MTTDIATYASTQLDQYPAGTIMTPEAAKALDDQLRACTRAVLREGTDYGVIPGTGDRRVLLKPGAEKLLQWFGLGFTCDRAEVDHDDDGQKQGVTYRATITRRLGDGRVVAVATCEGYAGYDEDRFYQSAEAAQFKAEAKERMWAAKDHRVANPNKWKFLTEYRAPWNTVIKMAQKRAIVGATIDATAAAGLFGQDEDDGPAAPDGGPSWYEQALAEAAAFTTEADGQALILEAADAAKKGLCTPQQGTHVKNRARQRISKLKTATVVDVEDLGRASDEGAKEEAQPADRHKKLIGAVQGHFKRLGFSDDDKAERLWAAAKLAGTGEIASLNDLDPDELGTVADALAKCRDRAKLEALLATGEVLNG